MNVWPTEETEKLDSHIQSCRWFMNSSQGTFMCTRQHPETRHHFYQRLFDIHRVVGLWGWWGFEFVGCFFFGGDFLFISYLNICSSQLLPTYLGDVTTECSALEFTVNHSKPFLYSYTIPFLSKQLEHEYFQKAAHMLCSHGAKFGRFEHTWL